MLQNPFATRDDATIETNLLALCKAERATNVDIILHLIVVRERRLHEAAGYDSLFSYCVRHLGLSKATAHRRKVVVEKAPEFPELIERMRDGRLLLCAAAEVAPHLTRENATQLLDAVVGMSYGDVKTYLVRRWKERQREATPQTTASASVVAAELPSVGEPVSIAEPARVVPPALSIEPPAERPAALTRTAVRVIDDRSSRVAMTLSDNTMAELKRAKELLSGKSDDEILHKALGALLDKIAPERRHARRIARQERKNVPKKAAPDQQAKPASSSRRGRLADRDQAVVANGCQCSYISKSGKRCESRAAIQVDHVKPWALGGDSTPANLRPLCASHNRYTAEQTFGTVRTRFQLKPRSASP